MKIILRGIATVVICIMSLSFTSPCRGVEYNYTELLPLGWEYSSVTGINENGVVAGDGYDVTTATAKVFIYSDGTYTELLPPGWICAYAEFINNNGDVVGFGEYETEDGGFFDRSFIYSGGTYTELLPSGWESAYIAGLNENGVVAGYGFDGTTDKGFIYSGGTYTELLPLGAESASVDGINDNGVVIGTGYYGTHYKGFIYSGGTYTELLPPGAFTADTQLINNSGNVVGIKDTEKGFIYSGGTYTELLLPGCEYLNVRDFNNNNVVVGSFYDGAWNENGFIAVPQSTLITLNTFIANPKAGKVILQWSTASEIDNAGFNLYRSESKDGDYIKINDIIIPAQGSSTKGESYEFVDNDVKNRKTYYYKLEDIDLNGTSTMHGPVSATPRWILGIFGIFRK
jgi:hypothetical protein